MSGNSDYSEKVLSDEDTAELLKLVAVGSRARLSSAELDGQTVWIKRFDTQSHPLAKRLHVWISPLLPWVFLRSSRKATGAAMARREARKAARFQAAGFATPRVLFVNDAVLVLTDVGEMADRMLSRLRRRDPERHDRLLVGMAAALGRVHSRNLCHGRPHPRDLFVSGENWGYLDFEEEPEAVMPMATAQARDVWLLFMHVAGKALHPGTAARALAAYRNAAPAGVMPELRRIVSFFSTFLPALKALARIGLGRDGRALLASTGFLREELRRPAQPTPVHNSNRSKSGQRHERP